MFRRLLLVLIVLLISLAGLGWWVNQRLHTPYQDFVGDEVFVDIPAGSSVSSIGNRLVAAGVLPDPWTFRLAARFTGADRRLKAGEYRFAGAATPLAVLDRLAAGDVFSITLTFPEGLTIAEMAEIFARTGLGTTEDFIGAARDPALISSYQTRSHSLEGYLFPDTYPVSHRAGASDLVHAMLARFDHMFSADLRGLAVDRGLTIDQVLTMASIVEKETARADERPIVAAVYYNRLKLGMPLQCDPTVVYALMLARKWNGNIRKVDLQINSPYNTYQVRGLPPGPIASPGLASIEAALKPADVPYLYFVSRNDGTHVFATTLAEHARNVRQWQGGR